MSPTRQEITAWPTLHTSHSQSQMHTLQHAHARLCRIQCCIHQICDFLPDTNHKSSSRAVGRRSHSVWLYCLRVSVYSKIRQRQAAWRLPQRRLMEQTGLTKGSLTVRLSWALRALSRSRVCCCTRAQTVSPLQKICSDDSRVIRCFQYVSEDETVWKRTDVSQQTPAPKFFMLVF